MRNLMIDKKKFDEDGYLLVRNVFTAAEIEQFRRLTCEQFDIDKKNNLDVYYPEAPKAKFVKGDLLSKEKLHQVLLDDRILQIARVLLGSDSIIYFGDSSYQVGTGLRGFHRDNIDRTNLDGPDWKGHYTLVRFGIYLQNHKSYSGGLQIKVGSHRNADGKVVFVGNRSGDVVAWNLRTLHSGNAVRLKLFPNVSLRDGREATVPKFLKKDEQCERISLFMTFALRSSHLNRFIHEYSLKRPDTIENLKASRYESAVLRMAEKKLEIMKLVPEQGH